MNIKKVLNDWLGTGIGLTIISIIGFLVRVYNLTLLPVFADEAIYIRWSEVMRSESTLRFLPLSDGKQPLFMWLVIPFLKMFSDPLFAGRFVSVVCGVLTIIGVFVATYILFKSKKISLFSALIYSVVPFSIFFDRMALADSLLSMFGIWIFSFSILLAQYIRLDLAMILGFLLGGALLTKSPALYFSLLIPVSVIFVKHKKDIIKFLLLLIPTYFIAYGIYNILRLGPNFSQLATRNLDYVYPLSHILTSPIDPFKPFLDRSREFYWMMCGGSLFTMWLLSNSINLKKYFKYFLLLTFWTLGPILASSEFSKTMTARYVYFSLPYFVISASLILIRESILIKALGYLLLILFLGQSLIFDLRLLTNPEKANLPRSERSGYLEEWTAGQGIKEISKYLNSIPKDQKIVVGTEGYFGTLPDGLQIYFDGITNVNVIGVGLQLEEVPKSLTSSKASGNKTFLVVNDERLHFIPQRSLKLISQFPKSTRPDGTHQSLMLYEVTNEKENH